MKKFMVRLAPCLLLACGCANQQLLDKPYPVWGKQITLDTGIDRNRHMQITIPAQKEADACVLIVHGMNEHTGRYAKIVQHFSDDFIVAGVDLTAHGLSNRVFAHAQQQLEAGDNKIDVSDAFLEQQPLYDLQPMRLDLEHALDYLIGLCDQADRKRPVFILSHSLGSLVSATWWMHTDNKRLKNIVNGIVFSGPAFSVTEVPGWRGWLQNPFIQFTYHTHEHFLNPHNEALPLLLFNQLFSLITVPIQDGIMELLSLNGVNQLFSPSTPDWVNTFLSNSEDERRKHAEDRYIIRRNLLRFVLGVEREVIAFRRVMTEFTLPYLLIYSEFDPITPGWGSTDFIAATYQNRDDNKVMMLAGENHHEQLFSTPELTEKIVQTIRAWFRSRIEKKPGKC